MGTCAYHYLMHKKYRNAVGGVYENVKPTAADELIFGDLYLFIFIHLIESC